MKELKEKVANAALNYLDDYKIIGVGTGSTVDCFIKELTKIKHRIDACVASSLRTENYLRKLGIPVIDLNVADELPIYIDGADEVNPHHQTIKGGGGALTREKIIATVATQFICIVDETKWVQHLGHFPVAVEIIPLARSFVARELVKLGGEPHYREGFITDNGNIILDVFHLNLNEPQTLEDTINHIPGVVENGIFARRLADTVLIASPNKITTMERALQTF